HHNVKTAAAGVLEHAIKPRALIASLGAANAGIAVFLHNLPTAALGYLSKLAHLVLDSLFVGGDSDINRCAFLHNDSLNCTRQIESRESSVYAGFLVKEFEGFSV